MMEEAECFDMGFPDQTVTVEAVITEINDNAKSIRADGFLMVDGRVVYKLTNVP